MVTARAFAFPTPALAARAPRPAARKIASPPSRGRAPPVRRGADTGGARVVVLAGGGGPEAGGAGREGGWGGEGAAPAAGRVDQDGFTGRDVELVHHALVRGEPGQRQRGRLRPTG